MICQVEKDFKHCAMGGGLVGTRLSSIGLKFYPGLEKKSLEIKKMLLKGNKK